MKWDDKGPSEDLEDRRGESSGGGGGGFRLGGGRLGIGGFLVLLVLSVVFKTDLTGALGGGGGGAVQMPLPGADPTSGQALPPKETSAQEEQLVKFMSFVLDDAQDNWAKVFEASNAQYTRARLVLFRNQVNTGCGGAQSASGPFYCPADQKVYIDLEFYDELRRRFGAPGDFAQAYVLAHEIGHHIQNLTGTEAKMRELQARNPGARNELSVRLELQADCYAGIWGKHAQQAGRLDDGDVDEALKAASAVGDDRISAMTGSSIRPESFTHGSAAQRTTWFRRGFDSGRIDACDTFSSK